MKMTATQRTLENADYTIQVGINLDEDSGQHLGTISTYSTFSDTTSSTSFPLEGISDLIECLSLFQAEQVKQRTKGELR